MTKLIKKKSVDPDTLHIAIATSPKSQMDDYIKSIKAYYGNVKKTIRNNYYDKKILNKSQPDHYYQPLVYHLFGGYDVCFITLIDNHKFSQKLFYPKTKDFNPNSFIIQTGICNNFNEGFSLHKAYTANLNKKFVTIINLKLNNSLLIGNGNLLVESTMTAISDCLGNMGKQTNDFIILQAFSWFEINVLIFQDRPESIGKMIHAIRNIRIGDLLNNKVLKNNSLINQWIKKKQWQNEFVITDSHSFFGVQYKGMAGLESLELQTEIEWQVKPGHLGNLLAELDLIEVGGAKSFNCSKPALITGKSDFVIKENNPTSFENNIKLFRQLDLEKKIQSNIKALKTKVNFELEQEGMPVFTPNNILFSKIKIFAYPSRILDEIDLHLKTLKISRQIRQKIIKIFHNFNSGIKDSILFPYFLDFRFFLDRLLQYVDEKIKSSQNRSSVETIETILQNYINVFQEAYNNRILNTYVFEEIYDFDLDYNSSIQQLLSAFNTVAYRIARFYSTNKNYAQLVMLNLKDTVSNTLSINYNVSHLTHPEFIFFTIDKEVTNSFVTHDPDVSNNIVNNIGAILEQEVYGDIWILYKTKKIIPEYLVIDIFRFVTVCNYDTRLYEYWLTAFNLQNPSLYDTQGNFNEAHFHKELLRILYVIRIFDKRHFDEIKCPLPELKSLWKRYLTYSKKIIEDMLGRTDKDGKGILDYIGVLLQKCDRICEIDHAKKIIRFEHIESASRNLEEQQTIHYLLQKLSYYYPVNFQQKDTFNKIYSEFEKGLSFPSLQECANIDALPAQYSITYIYALMHCYLKKIYTQNSDTRTENFMYNNFLNRNWKDGSIMQIFTKHEGTKKPYYLIDSFGGVFFNSSSCGKEYYVLRNSIIKLLTDFSMVEKKKLINDFLKTNA